jgi:hypothetical protein
VTLLHTEHSNPDRGNSIQFPWSIDAPFDIPSRHLLAQPKRTIDQAILPQVYQFLSAQRAAIILVPPSTLTHQTLTLKFLPLTWSLHICSWTIAGPASHPQFTPSGRIRSSKSGYRVVWLAKGMIVFAGILLRVRELTNYRHFDPYFQIEVDSR